MAIQAIAQIGKVVDALYAKVFVPPSYANGGANLTRVDCQDSMSILGGRASAELSTLFASVVMYLLRDSIHRDVEVTLTPQLSRSHRFIIFCAI